MDKDLAPIVLFVYNRPEHTQKVVEGILANPEAKDSILYVFADGPKENASEDCLEKIAQVRKYIHTIKGFKEVIVDESKKNRGLAPATIRAMTMVLNKHDRVIMIEDDDYPSPYFLAYENECLEKFKNDERIWYIVGYCNTKEVKPRFGDDVFMTEVGSSWGFGTWRRCWEKIIWDIDDLRGIFRHKNVVYGFNNYGGPSKSEIMIKLLNGKNSSWSVRFDFTSYLNKGLAVMPNKSLIANIGFDGTGTHCGMMNQDIEMMEKKPEIPEIVKLDTERNKQIKMQFVPHKFLNRILLSFGINVYTFFRMCLTDYYKIK